MQKAKLQPNTEKYLYFSTLIFSGYVDEAGNPVGPDGSAIEVIPVTLTPDACNTSAPDATPNLPAPIVTPVTPLPISTPNTPSPDSPAINPEMAQTVTPNQESNNYPCELSVSKTSVPGFVCKGQLLFEDNFNAGIMKGKIWTPETKFPGAPVSKKLAYIIIKR